MPSHQNTSSAQARLGLIQATSAFFLWGLMPLYFKLVTHVSAFEIIAHRVLWSAAFLGLILGLTRNGSGLALLRARPALWGWVGATTLLITGNWLIFVWGINAGRVLETSLGYYIMPLVSVLFALVFLGERLRPLQALALLLAALGVANQIVQLGYLPWVSLGLALTFAAYGLLRKKIPLDAVNGLFFETLLALPLALLVLGLMNTQGTLSFGSAGLGQDLLIAAIGILSAVPLMLFAAGVRHVSLITLGFLQYLAPSLTFLQAVYLFGEPIPPAQVLTFALIWTGLALYSLDLLRRRA